MTFRLMIRRSMMSIRNLMPSGYGQIHLWIEQMKDQGAGERFHAEE